MSTLLEDAPVIVKKIETSNEDGKAAHIVLMPEKDTGMSPQAYILQARVEGLPVTALCGYVWVPQQDPLKLPVCSKCLAIYHADGDNREDREEIPDA